MDDVVQDEPPAEREQDLEAIQAHMAMTMALAYEAIDASMKNSTLSDEHSHFHQSLADYRPRPPRLGVGAVRATTTNNNNNNGNEGNVKTGMARETARLHGRLAGKKRRRDEEEGDEGEMEEKKTSGSSGTTTTARKQQQQRQGDGSSDERESRAATISKTNTGSGVIDRFALPGTLKKKKKQKQEMEVASAEGGSKTGEEAGKKTVEEEKEAQIHSDLDAMKMKEKEKGSLDEELSRGATVSDTSKPSQGSDSGTGANDTSAVPEASSSSSKKKKKDRKKEKKKEEKMDDAKPVEEEGNEPSQAGGDAPQTEATKEQSQQASRHNVYGIPSSTSSGSTTDGSDARRTENAPGETGVTPHPTNEIESSSRTTKGGPPSPPLLSRISPEGGVVRSGIVSPLTSRFKFGYYPSTSPTRSAASSPSLSPPRQRGLGLGSGSDPRLGSGGHVRSPSSESKTSSGRVRMMTQAEWKRLRLKREVLAARTWTVPAVVRSKVEEEEEPEPEPEELKEVEGEEGEEEGEEVGVKSKGNLTESVATAIQPSSKGTTTRTTPIATMMLDTPVVQLEPLPDPRVGDDLSHEDDQGEKKKRKKNRKHKNRKRKREEQEDGMVMEDAAGDERPSREVDQGGEKEGEGDSDQE
ncbi:hypothetical protein FRC14_004464 [Serendipita sp. 396]|nr:hypothetical protein FRC14_004464 [Serendipita sp. 396]KAG8782172.1 hypothetical protein FRC15_007404 [Serendipita sp. 397]KAG8798230.1 hypothetical protein FRC16_007673 [Serendipita sp. 398]KAG8867431.1 hypothetical protein FRC20_005776 [Serendipita sp. 405]